MELPRRKTLRLKNFNYGTDGAYFITICTYNRVCTLSEIVGEGLAPPSVQLTDYGIVLDEQIRLLHSRFPSVSVDNYVIMPNHVHLLFRLASITDTGGASPSPTVHDGKTTEPTVIDVVRVLKSQSTRLCRGTSKLFQRSFYDHVVRREDDYCRIWNYIETNPAKWKEDRFYIQ